MTCKGDGLDKLLQVILEFVSFLLGIPLKVAKMNGQ